MSTMKTMAGAAEAAPDAVYYALYDDGSTGRIEVVGQDTEPALAKPGRIVTAEEYEERVAELRAAQDRARQEQADADEERTRTDYLALRAAGVPEATARRVSGYTGPDVEPESDAGPE